MTDHRPLLVGTFEIGQRLHLSRQRVQQLAAQRHDFPEPYQWLNMGRVWLAADIEAWIEKKLAQHQDQLQ